MSVRILLVDDHAILREGLRAILQSERDLVVVGEAANGQDALELADKLCPDVVVMDIGMSGLNGLEATRRLIRRDAKVKVLALSTHTDKQFVLGMLDAGAAGFVIKGAARKDLIQAIRTIMRNRQYISAGVADSMSDRYAQGINSTPAPSSATLGAKQREVLQLVAEGNTSREISEIMKISIKTVEAHRRNIMNKLSVHTVAELTKYAVREGMTSA